MNRGAGGPRGGRGDAMPGEKAKDFKGTLKKLVGYLGRHKWKVLVVWVLALFSTVFTIVGPRVLGMATDELFAGVMRMVSGTGGIDFTAVGRVLLTLLALYGVSALFSYLQGFLMSGVSMDITYRLRRDLSEKIHRLPIRYFDGTTHGEVLSRITNDVDTVSQSLNQSITQIITSVATLLGVIIMMLTISWQLTLVALTIIPISMVFVSFIVKKSQRHFFNQQKYLGDLNGHVEEMVSSHTIVKAFNGEEKSVKTFGEYNGALYSAGWKSNFLSGLMMPITSLIGNIAYVVICILGGSFAAAGTMTVGGIQSFIQYVRSFMQPINQIAQISNVLQQTAAAAERVFEFLDEPDEPEDAKDALSFGAAGVPLVGEIGFDHVSFGYKADHIIIKDFSAEVMPGQKIAIVGPTGAGKTTVVKLLMRYYDVNAGAIKIDGQDIRLFKRSSLRSLYGMVLQDTWLFSGTIMENIRYGRLDATDQQVLEAAKAAQVDHFVRTLPDGYQMVLNEEAGNISQGQKQLMTIARAILKDPDILILDEATSSVDTRTEVLIQRAMDHLMKGRTSFIIAHRLSTIKNADRILVMNDGDIVEQGSHDELMERSGFYAELYNSQFAQPSAS